MDTLADELGLDRIRGVIACFYQKAFSDGIIGHFFFDKDQSVLVERQFEFTANLLGSRDVKYLGRPVSPVHYSLSIRMPHYLRRQVLMRESMAEHNLTDEQQNRWISAENRLRNQILN